MEPVARECHDPAPGMARIAELLACGGDGKGSSGLPVIDHPRRFYSRDQAAGLSPKCQ